MKPKVLYIYLQYVALITEGLEMPGSWISTFGCECWCEDCFQREWCTIREDIEMEKSGYLKINQKMIGAFYFTGGLPVGPFRTECMRLTISDQGVICMGVRGQ